MGKFRFRGNARKNRESHPDRIPLRAIVPNLITSIAACGGMTCIVLCAQNYAMGDAVTPRHWFMALFALLVACVCDGMDGRVARLLNASSKLGAELDSLADFVNFGVAPAMFVYFWCLSANPNLPLILRNTLLAFALFYAMCDMFRLARFNTMLEQPTVPYWKHFFLGVPAPGGCWMVLTPAMLALACEVKDTAPGLNSVMQNPFFGMFMLFFIGSLMASRLPTISLKSVHISKNFLLPTMAGLLLLISFLVTNFWLTLGIVGAGYILTVPITGIIFLKVKAHYEAENAPAKLQSQQPSA